MARKVSKVEITPEMISTQADRISRAKAKILLQQPFYGVLLSMMDVIHEKQLPTFATDGKHVFFNAAFSAELTDNELRGVMLHEISHCIYMHCTRKRRMNRDPKKFNIACFPAGTMIPGSYKNIEDLVVGDSVLGSNGQYQKITEVMNRKYNGKLYNIKASGLLPFQCTDEHPIRVLQRKGVSYPIVFENDFVWKQAKDLSIKNDYLVVPMLEGNIEDTFVSIDPFISTNTKHTNKHLIKNSLSNGLPLDQDIAWFMGLYTAEGSKTTSDNQGIQFSLNKNETYLKDKIEMIANKLEYPITFKNRNDNSMVVYVRSTILSKLFEKYIGRGAKNKKIPQFILCHKDLKLVESFLDGFFEGDGCQSNNVKVFSTSSITLALQIQQAIGRLGYFANVQKNNVKERLLKGQVLPAGILYNVNWIDSKTTSRIMNGKTIDSSSIRWKIVGNNFVVPITEFVEEDFNDMVYNITTEDHTYTVSNALVHNCDYVINLEIRNMGEVLPKMALLDDKYRDMNAEQVYDVLPKDIEKQVDTMDDHIELDSDDWDDMEDKILTAYEATKNAQSKGDLPAGIKRWIEKMKKNKVQWQRIFHKYVGQALSKDDFSYARPNKRHSWRDIILPTLHSYKIGKVVIIVDTSGSIGKEQLEEFLAEIHKIGHLVDEVTVITCDAAVHECVKLNHIKELFTDKIKWKGGGGSSMVPAYELINSKRLNPELVVCLSDGMIEYPSKKLITFNNIWCITDEAYVSQVPTNLGKVIHIPRKNT